MRRFINILSTLSLALSVALCALWVRSIYYADGVIWSVHYQVESERGSVRFQYVAIDPENIPSWSLRTSGRYKIRLDFTDYLDDLTDAEGWVLRRGHFGIYSGMWPVRTCSSDPRLDGLFDIAGVRTVIVPHWFCALIALILPAIRARRLLISRRRRRGGACECCGYDLRHTRPVP